MPLTDPEVHSIDRYERVMLTDCDGCDRGSAAPVAIALCTIVGAVMGAAILFVVLMAAGAIK